MDDLRHVSILSIRVHSLTMEVTLAKIEEFIRSRRPHMVVTADASGVVMAQSDQELHDIINGADLVTPDSTGILWAAKRQGSPLPERVSGVDIVALMCERAAVKGYSVFLLGSAPGVADAAARRLKDRYPSLMIAGTHHGYFSRDEEPQVLQMVKEAHPDMLFVAMGIPAQEKWISRHMDELGVPVSMGVGGTFDVLSGIVKRAPAWMQKHGLEWIHRVARNPRKISKVLTLPVFVLMIFGFYGRPAAHR